MRNKSSYDWITLRITNINYVADRTGMSKAELKALLEQAAKQGKHEIRIPLGTRTFTREER